MNLFVSKNLSIKTMLFICILSLTVSCKKKEDVVPVIPETGTMVDIDSNIYKTVKIGNQWWMAENLKVTRYRSGVFITELKDSGDWVSQINGGRCEYSDPNLEAPGFLYNWFAISNADIIAPEGWHIPTDDEWKELEKTLGMTQAEADKLTWRGTDQGDKLKSNDQSEWTSFENIFSTNKSGFTALGGSCRVYNSSWGDPGLKSTGFWWTATTNGDNAWYRYLDYKSSKVFRSHADKHYGFSIRCVKD